MQVEVVVKRMQTNFDGRGIFNFGDFSSFHWPSKTAKFPFQTMDYSPWGQKIESAQNIHAGRGCCETHVTNFGGCGLLGFGDFALFVAL